ncbi:short-chain dehydrogenase [Haloprofundus marisrubri]|uniref:Short-chain dehydrogenase n=1 Tax=Haloprofundus marisrubri TaxID=1514971 RepID=A0A0W1R5L7_9EURY|nr:SDR family oxidoreductase [Haloprofundus marisrubri]KTG08381.1 short-chain dehydrogenase [Haloprofundus marisrubri]
MTDELAGRVALVTGASSGIGAATARKLAAEGAHLALSARREERLTELADELESEYGVETLVVPADVRDENAVEAVVSDTVDRFGELDIAVVNAGLGRGSGVDISTEEYRAMMDTNVDGAFFTTRAVLPHLRETDGNLVYVGSFAGKFPRPFNPVYAATKWWLRGFAHSVEAAAGDDGVGVTVVNPSEVRTEFGAEIDEAFEDRFDPGEVTDPEEIADAIAFATKQTNSTVSELDLYRRDKFSDW